MQKTKGLTFVGMLFTMASVIALGLLAMRIIPVYIEHYNIVHSLKTVSTLPKTDFSTDPVVNASTIKRSLMKQLDVNSIESIKDDNITITPSESGTLTVSIKYQVIRPLVANISLLFNFDDSLEVPLEGE